MDAIERAQVRQILNVLDETFRSDLKDGLDRINAELPTEELLRCSNTAKRVVDFIDELLAAFVTSAVDQAATVAMNRDCYAMLEEAVMGVQRGLDRHLEATIRSDSRAGDGNAARQMLESVKRKAREQLALHRRSFAGLAPSESIFGRLLPAGFLEAVSKPTKPTKSGRPLADHWDRLWAETAAALYHGDLQPKRQADIETFMAQCLDGAGLDVATSTVRKRARILWDRLQKDGN